MYKIYINDVPLFLLGSDEMDDQVWKRESCFLLKYRGKKEQFMHVVDMLAKPMSFNSVVIFNSDSGELFQDFRQMFIEVEAAGGLVFDRQERVLAILRRGRLDFPKGKKDPGESDWQTACREVMEETGLVTERLGNWQADTWHVYREKGKLWLKRTVWYAMNQVAGNLKLQHEEDIQSAHWLSIPEILADEVRFYRSLVDLVADFQTQVARKDGK
jgi:8-oxo-dGTP pyrophosphatase MutT (NUDIX family)